MQQFQLQAGSSFGRYEIQSRLAVGGMAEVWLGWLRGPEGFRKQVVLKTMLPHLAESPDLVRMFINEASIAARLNHPNVAQVFDFGEQDGRYFIAMEYLVGRTLRQIAKRFRDRCEPLAKWFVLRVVAETCEGLHYAHEYADSSGWLGLVHRDVSPENIMVSATGQVKILDFGAAYSTTSCETRRFVGKVNYVAPERVQGMPEDRRADIYSAGVVLYEYLTGARPFAGAQTDLLAQVMGGRLAQSEELASLNHEVARILRKAMAINRDDRYQTADELRSDLLGFLAETDPHKLRAELSWYLSVFPELRVMKGDHGERSAPASRSDPPPNSGFPKNDLDSFALDIDLEESDPDSMITAEAPPDVIGLIAATVRSEFAPAPLSAAVHDTLRPPPLDEDFDRHWDSADPVSTYPDASAEHVSRESDPGLPDGSSIYDSFLRKPPGADSRRSIFDMAIPRHSLAPSARGTDVASGPFTLRRALPPERAFGDRSFADTPSSSRARTTSGWSSTGAADEHFEQGLRFLKERQYTEAEREWARAVELDPRNRTYQSNLRRVREIIAARREAPDTTRDGTRGH